MQNSDKVSAHTAGPSLPGEGLLCSPSFMPLSCLSWHPQHPTQSQAATGTSSATKLPCAGCCHCLGTPVYSCLTAHIAAPLARDPQTPLGSHQRGPTERVSSEWLWCAGSKPEGRSAVKSPSHPRAANGFFQDLLLNQLDQQFLSSCWGVGGQEATMH